MDTATKVFRKINKRLRDKLITPEEALRLLEEVNKTGKVPTYMEEWELEKEGNDE